MEASTSTSTTPTPKPAVGKPVPVDGGTDLGPDGLTPELRKARESEILEPEEEFSGLAYLLGPAKPLEFDLAVQIDTPKGRQEVSIRIKQLDPDAIEKVDREARDAQTGAITQSKFTCNLLAESGVSMKDSTGFEINFSAQDFVISAPPLEGFSTIGAAINRAFRYNGGVLDQVAARIQGISGFEPDRVGVAQRVLAEAAKGL